MIEPKLLLVGPRAGKTLSGVALAFDLLIQGLELAKLDHCVVDAARGGTVAKSGTLSLRRAWDTVCVILLVWRHLLSCRIYYATMSTSSLGFIRDYLTVGFAKLLGRRTVLHLHGGGFEGFYAGSPRWLQCLIRANLRRTDTIIVLGELLKEQFYCAGEFVKPKLLVVPNGLTLGVDEPHAQIKELPTDGPVELLYLSSLMPSKGFFDVLKSMRILNHQVPGRFHLNLCGSFVDAKTETAIEVCDEASLSVYIEKHHLQDCVTYHGQTLGEKKEQQFQKAHIFLLPTSYPWEGQPLSIIEALAFSTPVISCYHKGIPELIEDGVNGRFVEPECPESIAQAVQSISRDAEGFKQMSHRAREHYEANFKREVHLERLIEVMRSE